MQFYYLVTRIVYKTYYNICHMTDSLINAQLKPLYLET